MALTPESHLFTYPKSFKFQFCEELQMVDIKWQPLELPHTTVIYREFGQLKYRRHVVTYNVGALTKHLTYFKRSSLAHLQKDQ